MMIIKVIQNQRKKNVRNHGLMLLVLLLFYSGTLIIYPAYLFIIHGIGLFIFTLLLISFISSLYRIKHGLRNKKIKVLHNTYPFPYPQKFSDHLVEVGGFFKRYMHKKQLIPDYLIEFREGHMLYLYPIIHEANEETYTIVRVHRFHLALVIDEQRKKRILHLGNAVLVN
jgi:Ca2+/Na+ antiporter